MTLVIMDRQHHQIKILLEYFQAIESGEKTFEVRFNDRNYHVHDILHLREWQDDKYTGKEMAVEVTYLLDNPDYCKEGFVIMAIKKTD